MKVSLIFSFIVQATLPLMQKIFFDSINLLVHRCDTKNKQICLCLLLKQTVKLHQLSISIQVKFGSLQKISKAVFLIGLLNLQRERETSGGSWFATNSLLVCYKWSKTRSSSCTSLVFLVTFTKACPIPIQNNMHS